MPAQPPPSGGAVTTADFPELILPAPPAVQSGRAIYDSIMRQIEQELTSEELPKLKERYASETPEEKETRRRRYETAFRRYYEAYEAYLADMHTRIQRYHREAMRSIEEWNRAREERRLDDFAASLFELTS